MEIKGVASAPRKTNPLLSYIFPFSRSPANNTPNASARSASRLMFTFREHAYSETYKSGNIWLSADEGNDG